MASLSSKVKTYLANNGVNEVDFTVDVLLQDDSNGKGPIHQKLECIRCSSTDIGTTGRCRFCC